MVQTRSRRRSKWQLTANRVGMAVVVILLAVVSLVGTIRSSLLPSHLIDGSLLFRVDDVPILPTAVKRPIKIAYAVSVTSCGSKSLADAAAVLRHSIRRASVHGPLGGRYDYECIALYHPQAEPCALALGDLGWNLMPRHVLVNVSDIRGDYLRNAIETNGCCGEKELIKLEAYTLTDYPIAVHLDLDALVLKPMDDLFDMMLSTKPKVDVERYQNVLMRHSNQTVTVPERINALFTYDYNMVPASHKVKPVQGGLIVLRPDLAVYEEFRQIVLEGDFRDGKNNSGQGWGGSVGPFFGAQTIQGVVPYYYNILHPGQSLELNRCVFNQMCDAPREPPKPNSTEPGICLTGEADCEDCRARPLEDIVTAHYTICLKPWWCHAHASATIEHRLCRNLMREWFRVRSEMEQSWGRASFGTGNYERDLFSGFCTQHGDQGYLPIQQPYGQLIAIQPTTNGTR